MTGSTVPSLGTSWVAAVRPSWPVLASAAAATSLVAVLSIIERGGEVPTFGVHLVVLVLAAGAAYVLDDTAKELTDVAPQTLLRRRAVIVVRGFGVIAAAWAVVMVFLHWRSPSAPLVALTWETVGLSCLAVAAAAVVARRGETEPGNLVASAMGLIFVGFLILQPMLNVVVLVTTADDPNRGDWWTGVIVVATITFVIASRDAASGRLLKRRGDSS